jgi:hypothetical protein
MVSAGMASTFTRYSSETVTFPRMETHEDLDPGLSDRRTLAPSADAQLLDVAACMDTKPQPRQCRLVGWQRLLESEAERNTSLMEIARLRRYEAEALARALADCEAVGIGDNEVVIARSDASTRYFATVKEGAPTPPTRLEGAARRDRAAGGDEARRRSAPRGVRGRGRARGAMIIIAAPHFNAAARR